MRSPIVARPDSSLRTGCALTLITLAATLAACGSSNDDASTSAGTPTATTPSPTPSPAVSTGSSSAATTAAEAFLATLDATQKTVASSSSSASTVLFELTRENAIQWTNLPGNRHGLRLNSSALSTEQLAAADTLIANALSSAGKTEADEIRAADDVLAGSAGGYGSGLYSVALLGTPSSSTPWMLQLIGHHLAYNITYNGSHVSGTPAFLGVEPPNWVVTSTGSVVVNGTAASAGTQHAPLESQRAALDALAQSLQADTSYASAARLSGTYNDVVAGASGNTDGNFGSLAYPSTDRGLLYTNLDSATQGLVRTAIESYVNTMTSDIASELLSAYESDTALASTWVGYSPGQGGSADFSAYPNAATTPLNAERSYIRIDGPRVWIEFVVQAGVVYRNNIHYHSIWRDKVADYGGQFGSGGATN